MTHNNEGSPGRAVIVSETEGIGKTQLMLRYCYDHRHSYVHGIYWIDATTPAAMHQSVAAVLLALGVKRRAIQELQTHSQIANALFASLARLGTNWLLCFDGLALGAGGGNDTTGGASSRAGSRSSTMAIFKESYILDEEPRKVAGHMMITSCDIDPDVWHRVAMGSPLELGALSKEDGMLLLLRGARGVVGTNRAGLRARCERLESNERHALKHVSKSVAHGLGGHPFAIVLAGAYLFGQGMKCGSFVDFRVELRGMLREAYLARKEAASLSSLNRPGSPLEQDAAFAMASVTAAPLDVRIPAVMDVVVALNWDLLSDPSANLLLAVATLGPTDVSPAVVARILSTRSLHDGCNTLDLEELNGGGGSGGGGGSSDGGGGSSGAASPHSRVHAWAADVVEATAPDGVGVTETDAAKHPQQQHLGGTVDAGGGGGGANDELGSNSSSSNGTKSVFDKAPAPPWSPPSYNACVLGELVDRTSFLTYGHEHYQQEAAGRSGEGNFLVHRLVGKVLRRTLAVNSVGIAHGLSAAASAVAAAIPTRGYRPTVNAVQRQQFANMMLARHAATICGLTVQLAAQSPRALSQRVRKEVAGLACTASWMTLRAGDSVTSKQLAAQAFFLLEDDDNIGGGDVDVDDAGGAVDTGSTAATGATAAGAAQGDRYQEVDCVAACARYAAATHAFANRDFAAARGHLADGLLSLAGASTETSCMLLAAANGGEAPGDVGSSGGGGGGRTRATASHQQGSHGLWLEVELHIAMAAVCTESNAAGQPLPGAPSPSASLDAAQQLLLFQPAAGSMAALCTCAVQYWRAQQVLYENPAAALQCLRVALELHRTVPTSVRHADAVPGIATDIAEPLLQEGLGESALAIGDLDGARAAFDAALASRICDVAEHRPADTRVAFCMRQIARVQLERGDWSAATVSLRAALSDIAALPSASSAALRAAQGRIHHTISQAEQAAGNKAEAARQSQRAFERYRAAGTHWPLIEMIEVKETLAERQAATADHDATEAHMNDAKKMRLRLAVCPGWKSASASSAGAAWSNARVSIAASHLQEGLSRLRRALALSLQSRPSANDSVAATETVSVSVSAALQSALICLDIAKLTVHIGRPFHVALSHAHHALSLAAQHRISVAASFDADDVDEYSNIHISEKVAALVRSDDDPRTRDCKCVPDSPLVARGIDAAGDAHAHAGRPSTALRWFAAELEMLRRLHGEDAAEPEVGVCLLKLGLVLASAGLQDQGRAYLEDGRTMLIKLHRRLPNLPVVARLHLMRGFDAFELLDAQSALSMFQRALSSAEQVWGGGQTVFLAQVHEHMGQALDAIGNCPAASLQYKLCLELAERDLDDAEATISGSGRHGGGSTASSSGHGGGTVAEGREGAAAEDGEGSRGGDDSYGGVLNGGGAKSTSLLEAKSTSLLERIRVVSALLNYGAALTAQANATKLSSAEGSPKAAGNPNAAAIEHLERCQTLWQRFSVGEMESDDGEGIAELEPAILNALSAAWQTAGECEQALQFEELSVAALVRMHGEDTPHPDIAFALHGLAVAFKQCRKRDTAADKCRASLEMMQELAFPDAHPGVRLAAALLHELS